MPKKARPPGGSIESPTAPTLSKEGFFTRNFAAILASAVTLAGTLVAVANIIVGYLANKNAQDLEAKKEIREFVATHKAELFGTDRRTVEELKRVMVVTFPSELVDKVLGRIIVEAPAQTRDIFNTVLEEGDVIEGKVGIWGGPTDLGVAPDENLALVTKADLGSPEFTDYFLETQPSGTTGLGRRLNPDSLYMSARWNYAQFSKEFLRTHKVVVRNPKNGKQVEAQPVDWGPNAATAELLMFHLGLPGRLG